VLHMMTILASRQPPVSAFLDDVLLHCLHVARRSRTHAQKVISAGVIQVLDEVRHVFTYLNEREVEFWKVLDELKEIGGAFSPPTVHSNVITSELEAGRVRLPFPVLTCCSSAIQLCKGVWSSARPKSRTTSTVKTRSAHCRSG
jgi:hypothetical protein